MHRAFEQRIAYGKNMMTQHGKVPIAIVRRTQIHLLVRDLTDIALRGAQYFDPFLEQLLWWQRYVTAAVQAQKSGH